MERQISESCIDDIAQRVASILFEDEVDEGIMDTVKGVVKDLMPQKPKEEDAGLKRLRELHKRVAVGPYSTEEQRKEYRHLKGKVLDRLRGMGHSNPEAHEIFDRKMDRDNK